MIIVGLIRSTTFPKAGVVQDIPYEVFLIQLEASIAVFMASVSAFRSLFAPQGSRAARRKPNIKWSFRGRRLPRSDSDLETNGLPAIPGATMTGLRSFIRNSSKPTVMNSESDEISDDFLLTEVTKPEMLHTPDLSKGEVRDWKILCDNASVLTSVLIEQFPNNKQRDGMMNSVLLRLRS